MFESLPWQIGGGKIRDDVDKLHIRVYMFVKRQSEPDFPRGAIRNGIIDGTKCQSEERKGNLFLLLCIANTLEGSMKLQTALNHDSSKWEKYMSSSSYIYQCVNGFTIVMIRKRLTKQDHLLQRCSRCFSGFFLERRIQMVIAYPKCMEWLNSSHISRDTDQL
jgi:hypothetical protein